MENNNMIYLDNSAGSHPKPPAVAAAMAAAINEYGANPGRGNYAMSRRTSAFVEKAREKLADFFHLADPRQVIFTAGATMSLNMGLRGLLSDGKKLLLCGMEHNAGRVRCLFRIGESSSWLIVLRIRIGAWILPGTRYKKPLPRRYEGMRCPLWCPSARYSVFPAP